jgi:hypothetical protein
MVAVYALLEDGSGARSLVVIIASASKNIRFGSDLSHRSAFSALSSAMDADFMHFVLTMHLLK